MDAQRVVVFGKGLGSIPVNIPTTFTILTQSAGVGELKCSIKGVVWISFRSFSGDGLEQYEYFVLLLFLLVFCFSNLVLQNYFY